MAAEAIELLKRLQEVGLPAPGAALAADEAETQLSDEGADALAENAFGPGEGIKMTADDLAVVVALAKSMPTGEAGEEGGFWAGLSKENVTVANVARGFHGSMAHGSRADRMFAAASYMTLLSTPGCPVFSLFDPIVFSCLLKLLHDSFAAPIDDEGEEGQASQKPKGKAAKRSKAKKGADDEDEEEGAGEAEKKLALQVLLDMNAFLGAFKLSGQADTLKALVEGLLDVTRFGAAAGDAVSQRAADAAQVCIEGLFMPAHGHTFDTAALVLRLLAPSVLMTWTAGMGGSMPAVPGKGYLAVRGQALALAQRILRASPEARQALGGLARHICLKVPDKADFRAHAVDAVAELAEAMPPLERHRLVRFLWRLSRAPKVAHRVVAVDLAVALLRSLPEPLATEACATDGTPVPSSVGRTPGTGPRPSLGGGSKTPAAKTPAASAKTPGTAGTNLSARTPGSDAGMTPGSDAAAVEEAWGVVCLRVLLQRCSDKSATVRARALGQLAAAISHLEEGAEGAAGRVQREALSIILATAHDGPQSPNQSRRTPEGPEAPPGAQAAAPPLSGNAMATPFVSPPFTNEPTGSPMRAEEALLPMLRRRCRDDKAAVRKGGLQLLEQLLLLWGEPSSEDVAAVAAACADALVSVRKAGLSAASSLL